MRNLILSGLFLTVVSLGLYNDFLPLLSFPRFELIQDYKIGWRTAVQVSNHYVKRIQGNTQFIYDYELTSLRVTWTGRWDDMLFRINCPVYSVGPGVLDEFISGWHQLWGFPDAGRSDDAYGLVQQSWKVDGLSGYTNQSVASGLGDMNSQLLIPVLSSGLSMVLGLSLPTGTTDYRSDAVGYAAGLQFRDVHGNYACRIVFYEGGLNAFTRSLVRRRSFEGNLFLQIKLFGVKTDHELCYYTPPVTDTGIPEIDNPGLIYQVAWSVNDTLRFIMQEDLTLSNAPDFIVGCEVKL